MFKILTAPTPYAADIGRFVANKVFTVKTSLVRRWPAVRRSAGGGPQGSGGPVEGGGHTGTRRHRYWGVASPRNIVGNGPQSRIPPRGDTAANLG